MQDQSDMFPVLLFIRCIPPILASLIPAAIARSNGRSFAKWYLICVVPLCLVAPFGIGGLVLGAIIFAGCLAGAANGSSKPTETDQQLSKLNKCDGCGTTFRDFYGLKKIEERGYLCTACRQPLDSTAKTDQSIPDQASS